MTTIRKTTCEVCCDDFVGKGVGCGYCHFETCSDCAQKYILGQLTDAKCMNCRKQWTREFLVKQFSQKFIAKDYKNHLEKVILDREKSRLPETQPLAEQEKRRRDLEAKIHQKRDKEKELRKKMLQETDSEKKGEIRVKLKVLEERIHALRMERYHLTSGRAGENLPKEPVKVRRACPQDNCRGFLTEDWKCGLCKTEVCSKCHEIVEGGSGGASGSGAHKCDPDIVKSVKMMAKDSRPCPSCSSMIYKISGCDQMWCTACKKAFSWLTGEIVVHGVVHNPHYFEYMQQQRGGGAERIELINCQLQLPNYSQFEIVKRDFATKNKKLYENFNQCYRVSGEADDMRRTYEGYIQPDVNRPLRVQYMLGDIDEEKFKTTLQRKVKAQQKYQAIHQVVDSFCMISRELMWKLLPLNAPKEVKEILDEMEEMRKYINDCWKQVGKVYNCKVPVITDEWDLQPVHYVTI